MINKKSPISKSHCVHHEPADKLKQTLFTRLPADTMFKKFSLYKKYEHSLLIVASNWYTNGSMTKYGKQTQKGPFVNFQQGHDSVPS